MLWPKHVDSSSKYVCFCIVSAVKYPQFPFHICHRIAFSFFYELLPALYLLHSAETESNARHVVASLSQSSKRGHLHCIPFWSSLWHKFQLNAWKNQCKIFGGDKSIYFNESWIVHETLILDNQGTVQISATSRMTLSELLCCCEWMTTHLASACCCSFFATRKPFKSIQNAKKNNEEANFLFRSFY